VEAGGGDCVAVISQRMQPFDDPRTDDSHRLAPFDLWRVHLEQCPECGRVHGASAGCGAAGSGAAGRPERHIYEYTCGISEDLMCPLCGEPFQSPAQAPCGHHYCAQCLRTLLNRTAGRVACPLDGQVITRFAMRPADSAVLDRVENLRVRCPVCREEVRKAHLQHHLQDPVNMVEAPLAYETILKPFYLSCPLSNFTVGEFNGSSALIRLYRRLGPSTLKRFVLTTEDFIVLPDPKMGAQPHTEDDVEILRTQGGYFNAWWVHPSFRREVWWLRESADAAGGTEAPTSPSGNGKLHPAEAAFRACREAMRKRDEAAALLGGCDCSAEPWHESSFVHTWSKVQKPTSPRYLCCLRDLRGEDLPALEAFRRDVLRFLGENYGVDEGKVWIYCHYPSSARYSTLHFHIIFAGTEASRFEKFARKVERPHQLSRQFPLSRIIEDLRSNPSHFETCTLNYYLGDKADLMDPISAFFGCSPHRYLKDFTFHWDPGAVAASRSSRPRIASIDSAVSETVEELASARASPTAGPRWSVAAEERMALQICELRRAVDGVRQLVQELGEATKEAAKEASRSQCVDDADNWKLALLQLTSLSKANANFPAMAAAWALAGVAAGGLLAAALASVMLRRTSSAP